LTPISPINQEPACHAVVSTNGASGTSDMAGEAARGAVEGSGSCRDTRQAENRDLSKRGRFFTTEDTNNNF